MEVYYLMVITLSAFIMQFSMGFKVGTSRSRLGVMPPAISGNVEFERLFRAHQNTIEYMPMFVVFLWFAGLTGGNQYWIPMIGIVWIMARIVYFVGYSQGNPIRGKAFIASVLCLVILLLTTVYNLIITAIR